MQERETVQMDGAGLPRWSTSTLVVVGNSLFVSGLFVLAAAGHGRTVSTTEVARAAGSPEEKAARQAELAKEAFAAAATNMRDLAEMVTKSAAEAFDTVTKRMTENLEEIRASLVRKQAK